MMIRNWIAAICSATLMLSAGQALAIPDLTRASTFVLLDWNKRVTKSSGGGGVSRLIVQDYAGQQLLGGAGAPIYATCFEQSEYLRTSGDQWYAVFPSLVGLPSAGMGINTAEESTIANILGAKFGADFTETGASTARNIEDVKAIQSILWEAGATAGDDLADDLISGPADNAGGKDRAEDWLKEKLPIASLDLFGLVSVDLTGDRSDGIMASDFTVVRGQDLATYKIPSGSPRIPLPAPLMLVGVGLLGLYRFSGRRSRS
jgi:hypothetical protein